MLIIELGKVILWFGFLIFLWFRFWFIIIRVMLLMILEDGVILMILLNIWFILV